MTKECGNMEMLPEWFQNMPYWLISVISFILAFIAKDKKWNRIKVILYLIGIGTGAIAAMQAWVRAFSYLIFY